MDETESSDDEKAKSQTAAPQKKVNKSSSFLDKHEASVENNVDMVSECQGCDDMALCKSLEAQEKKLAVKRAAVRAMTEEVSRLENLLEKKRSGLDEAKDDLAEAMFDLHEILSRHVWLLLLH